MYKYNNDMILFLYGPNSFQMREKLQELKKLFLEKNKQGQTSLQEIDGQNLNLLKLNELFASNSLFSKKRFIIVKNVFQNKDKKFFQELVSYLADIEKKDNALLFYEETLFLKNIRGKEQVVDNNEQKLTKDKQNLFFVLKQFQYAQYFPMLDNKGILAWVNKKLAQEKITIDFQAGQALLGLVGNNLWSINNEINKLINYKQAKQENEIKLVDIETMIIGHFDQGIFALTDAISNKNKKLAVQILLEQIKLGVAGPYLFTMLVRQFRILLQIRQGLDSGWSINKIRDNLKLHPYVFQKGVNQARNFKLDSLKNIFQILTKADYNQKTGVLNMETMLGLLIVQI